jgi:predicted dehydrogenase/threonine dehydrogenase-like Zn-dependent dehydrogenase
MKQVVQSARSGKLSLREVPESQVKAGSLLVKTQASLISAGTERMMVQFAKKNLLSKAQARPDLVKKVLNKAKRDGIVATMQAVMARLDEPLPLGYSAVGKVVAVGHGLEGFFQTGQRVAVAGAGLANHAELNVIPQNLAVPVPDDVSDEEACFATLGSIALHGVRCLEAQLGDVVGVVGTGLVGQLALQFLTLSGCRVIAFDYDAKRLELASRMGAEMVWNLADGSPTEAVMTLTRGIGCDSVLIAAATDSSAPFETAAEIARDRAHVSLVGITGTAFPYRDFMKKELSVVVSRSYGPGRYDDDYEGRGVKYPQGYVRWTETENLAECVRLMSPSQRHPLAIKPLITHRFDFSCAEEAYKMVTQGTEPHLGIVLFYKESGDVPAHPQLVASRSTSNESLSTGSCVLGAIGAGNFARMMILPLLKKISGCTLHSISTLRGISAEHSQKAFGFQSAGTDVEEIFNNPEINAVLITTPHSSHANLTARALEAGKHVLVEKPLALDMEQLNQVITARNGSNSFFQVGFNRRFAPLTQKVRQHLAKYSGEKSVLLRVNAGQLPPESWQNDPEEGHGRILGEFCHFIDLARYFVGSSIKSVRATATTISHGACDDLTVILSFLDGSLATIVYTAMGDSAFSKERFECYVGGTVATIEDFRTMTVVVDGKPKTTNLHAQDKGHKAELEAFVNAVRNGGPAPIDEQELIESSHATIAVLDALKTGNIIKL